MNEPIKSYQDLIVWKKSIHLCTEVYRITVKFPESEKFGIINQIRRASVSVSSNIAEGWGRNSTKNYTQFLKISRGSLLETQSLLVISKQLNFLSEDEYVKIDLLIVEISKMLNKLISTLENNIANKEQIP
jgi:four helix bundle protein